MIGRPYLDFAPGICVELTESRIQSLRIIKHKQLQETKDRDFLVTLKTNFYSIKSHYCPQLKIFTYYAAFVLALSHGVRKNSNLISTIVRNFFVSLFDMSP